MSLIDRINRWILDCLDRNRPTLSVEGKAIVVTAPDGGRERFSLAELSHAVLFRRDIYVGDVIVLRLGFADGRQVELPSEDPAWHVLTEALDRSGRIAMPSAEWQLLGIADGPDAPPRALL